MFIFCLLALSFGIRIPMLRQWPRPWPLFAHQLCCTSTGPSFSRNHSWMPVQSMTVIEPFSNGLFQVSFRSQSCNIRNDFITKKYVSSPSAWCAHKIEHLSPVAPFVCGWRSASGTRAVPAARILTCVRGGHHHDTMINLFFYLLIWVKARQNLY